MDNKKKSFTEKIREFYQKSKASLAYILLATILLTQFLPENILHSTIGSFSQLGLFTSFGFLMLEILFEINKQVSKKETDRLKRYDDWNEALPDAKAILDRQIEKENIVKIKIIGVSLRHHWYFVKGIIEPLLRIGKKVEISLEMAMLGDKFYETHSDIVTEDFEDKYKLSGQAIEKEIKRFKKEFNDQFQTAKWNIELYKYNHLPNIVGILIDNNYLFTGLTFLKNGTFRAGGSDYDLYTEDDTFGGHDKIDIFNSWFEYIKSKSKDEQK